MIQNLPKGQISVYVGSPECSEYVSEAFSSGVSISWRSGVQSLR